MKYPKFIKENDTIGIIAPSAGAYDIKKKNSLHDHPYYVQKH